VAVRHSAWWIENSDYGRLWLGFTDMAGAGIAGIDLSGSNVTLIGSRFGHWNNTFNIRPTNPGFNARNFTPAASALDWGNMMTHGTGDVGLTAITRENNIKYVSPTLMGFIFSAAFGEDDVWDVALRYAGEFHGYRVAAGVSYAENRDGNDPHGNCADLNTANQGNFVRSQPRSSDVDCNSFQVGASVMQSATGLFVSGAYGILQDDHRDELFGVNNVDVNGRRLEAGEDEHWYVRAGIAQNWTGLGNTILFGQYAANDGVGELNAGSVRTINANDALVGSLGLAAAANAFGVNRVQVDVWTLGMVQRIDAAAMELYIAYSNYDANILLSQGTVGSGIKADPIENFDAVLAGGRINF